MYNSTAKIDSHRKALLVPEQCSFFASELNGKNGGGFRKANKDRKKDEVAPLEEEVALQFIRKQQQRGKLAGMEYRASGEP